ncbi:hypothetical protein [Levilactobacillus brevis]|uniref:hypothetical protein n=1 Tax=Levilactobacillus brevis TaxID=1580 RepID=UPI001BAB63DA|nr:hypothetical protein [Levilactobacillus brevis]MBS0979107.1 hypothetical protein [Levilactobacillus brevis]
MTKVKNINFHLTEANQKTLEELRQYLQDTPELVKRVALRDRGGISTNRLVNAILTEFSYLFLQSDLSFVEREKQLLAKDESETLSQATPKSARQLRQIERDTQRLLYLSLIINGAANVTKFPEAPLISRLDTTNDFGRWLTAIDDRIDRDWKQVRK